MLIQRCANSFKFSLTCHHFKGFLRWFTCCRSFTPASSRVCRLAGSSLLQLPAWGQGALREQPRREVPHQTAAPPAPASRQWGESPDRPARPPPYLRPSIYPPLPLPTSGHYGDKSGAEGGDRQEKSGGRAGRCLVNGRERDGAMFVATYWDLLH